MAKRTKMETHYPCGPNTAAELEQLCYGQYGTVASRALRAANQLGVIDANLEMRDVLRQNPLVAAELDEALASALASERAGGTSHRFPE